MNRLTAFREVKALVVAASDKVSINRISLATGCCPSTLQGWIRRRQVLVVEITIKQTLPKLHSWESWVSSYEAGRAEGLSLLLESGTDLDQVHAEVKELLCDELAHRSTRQVAWGCEVAESQVSNWTTGSPKPSELPDLIRALGHLRHRHTWPPRESTPAPERSPVAANA